MIKIELPSPLGFAQKAKAIRNKAPEKAGIYLIYGANDELLYIGKTTNLKKRLLDHKTGKSHIGQYASQFVMCKWFKVSDSLKRDIYELYFIRTMQPKYNTLLKTASNH